VISNFWQEFRQKATRFPQRIVLADGEDSRVVKAAAIAAAERIADPILIGSTRKVEPLWKQYAGSLPLPCLDPLDLNPADRNALVAEFRELPKNRNISDQEALTRLQDPLWFGCLYTRGGHADGFVGGASRTTADTLRAVFSVVGLAPHAPALFGFFLIEGRGIGAAASLVLLADCAVIPDPSPKQLSQIAVGSAAAFEFFVGEKSRVAFLSFSTHGSAEHASVDKIRQALDFARQKAPQLILEGEWQADAALDRVTAQIKGVGDSPMAGQANVLIAPDLNCGNIAYKLIQRLGGCRAVGPILWGTAKPANDLSRGCSTEDVLDMIALTALQAQGSKTPVPAKKEPTLRRR